MLEHLSLTLLVPVAYLCVGYCEAFAAEPELKTAGWLPEVPLEELVFYDRWGRRSRWTSRSAGAGTPERALEEGRAGVEQVGDLGIGLCRLPVVEEPPAARRSERVGVDPAEPAGRLGLIERMQPHRLTRAVEADRRCRRCVAAGTPTSTHVVNV